VSISVTRGIIRKRQSMIKTYWGEMGLPMKTGGKKNVQITGRERKKKKKSLKRGEGRRTYELIEENLES